MALFSEEPLPTGSPTQNTAAVIPWCSGYVRPAVPPETATTADSSRPGAAACPAPRRSLHKATSANEPATASSSAAARIGVLKDERCRLTRIQPPPRPPREAWRLANGRAQPYTRSTIPRHNPFQVHHLARSVVGLRRMAARNSIRRAAPPPS